MAIKSIPRWTLLTTGVIAMAARRARRALRPAENGTGDGESFGCHACGEPLALESVLCADAERVDGSISGYVLFEHDCGCRPGELLQTRAWGSYPAFVALFGRMPVLPYQSPFAAAPVAEDDPALTRWAWEIDLVRDVDEFLLFLDDACSRRAG